MEREKMILLEQKINKQAERLQSLQRESEKVILFEQKQRTS
jgi:hypothetical protein